MSGIAEIERRQRLQRFLPILRKRQDPKVPDKMTLMMLMQDLKDEGNESFRNMEYKNSWEHYHHALFVAGLIEQNFYVHIDKTFLSTVYCNAALCSLKREDYVTALQDAEKALECKNDSIKALYRKSMALKELDRLEEALAIAVKGKVLEPKNFFDLEQAIKDQLKAKKSKNTTAVSGKETSTTDPVNEWLEATNAPTPHEKKQNQKLKNMNPKKKKSKGQSNQAPKQDGGQKKQDVDSDSDSDSIRSDKEFAIQMMNLKSNSKQSESSKGKAATKATAVKVNAQAQPKKWGSSTSLQDQDTFVTVGKKPSDHWQKQHANINWPLSKYTYRLVCQTCFRKEAEGVKGYLYRPELSHSCRHDVLIARDKAQPKLNWLKIRPLPGDGREFVYQYKICHDFQNGMPCHLAACSFAHNHLEINLWTMNRDKKFDIAAFIRDSRRQEIFSSDLLEKEIQREATPPPQYIPGLNNPSASTFEPTIAYSHPPPQLQQKKMPFSWVNHSHSGTSMHHETINVSFPPSLSGNMQASQMNNRTQHADHRPSPPPQPNTKTSPISTCTQIANPLPKYEYKLCCESCLKFTGVPWLYHYISANHFCRQNKLVYHIQDNYGNNVWVLVRERITHRNFNGGYNLCLSVKFSNFNMCQRQQNCSFAHNPIEQYLWQLEKDDAFNISEFIIQNRTTMRKGSMSADSIKELMIMYGGYFRYICRDCFFSPSSMVSSKGEKNRCTAGIHEWNRSRVLTHVNDGKYTVVDVRKFQHTGAFYRLCNFLGFCHLRSDNTCRFAHSPVEMSVWRLERDSKLTRDDIVSQSVAVFRANHMEQPPPTMDQGTVFPSNSNEAVTNLPSNHHMTGNMEPSFKIAQVCGSCWGNGQRCHEDGKKDKCVKGHSNFKIKSAFIHSSGKEIRQIPFNILNGKKLVLCNLRNKCTRQVCTHPHSQEELDTWSYMLRTNVKSLSLLAEKCMEIERTKTCKIQAGESVVNVMGNSVSAWQNQAKSLNQIIAPGDEVINEHYCHYCGISCSDQRKWDDHCTNEKHINNVNWDREHQWNCRQPPWGQGRSLTLCARHFHNKSCPYSHVIAMYNLCKYAHSQDELDEWKERLEFRKMKRKMAHQRLMFSFTETVLEEYNNSRNSVEVIANNLPDVTVKCNMKETEYKYEKNSTHTWTFTVFSKRILKRVGLLHNRDRHHFFLVGPNGSHHQVTSGDIFHVIDAEKDHYKIPVTFTASLFGSFSQSLVLDFGMNPVLEKKLVVEVGLRPQQIKLEELRKDLKHFRWTGQNREIVRCDKIMMTAFEGKLLKVYKEPVESDLVVTADSFKELNQHNYIHKMHKLLYLEEMTRQRLIARYNLVQEIEPCSRIEESGQLIFASDGDVFIKVALLDSLTEDTQAGRLVLKSVNTALIGHPESNSKNVYEAHLVRDLNYGYDGLGKDYVYLVLRSSSASALGIKVGTHATLEIQFQMDRMFFCRMHYALDTLKDPSIFFPDVKKFKSLLGCSVNVSSSVLNEDQMIAVSHIVRDREGMKPPFVMYGPFGTGKTETLAQSTMALLKDKKTCRVLICTQSNSAADLYITKHFDKFIQDRNRKYKMLRIIDKLRRRETVNQVVIPYCYMTSNNTFDLPSKEYILSHQIVLITVENSIHLNDLGLYDQFTHIFVDEAGQALECETMMPLSLASSKTCVVLTGDHLQISPPVYSKEACRQNFNTSILVRLFNHYDQMANANIHDQNSEQKSQLNIFLSINYRTKQEILRFISTVFYGGPDNLKAFGKIPAVVTITPLMFFCVQGKELQVETSTSYVNEAEAQEVVAQARQMLQEWPEEWGERDPKSIAILTAYFDQVKYIRLMLKDRSMPELKQVFVGTVQAVQGKEFRAVFISTVRTTNILREAHILKALEEGDDIGDLGFLSNPKLINTALTRAQSFVGVVGDPFALCMIGECIQQWRTYIKHCSNMGSMRPESYSYNFIKNHVIQIHMGPDEEVIERLSQRNEEKMRQSFPPLQPSAKMPKVAEQSADDLTDKPAIHFSPDDTTNFAAEQQYFQPLLDLSGMNFQHESSADGGYEYFPSVHVEPSCIQVDVQSNVIPDRPMSSSPSPGLDQQSGDKDLTVSHEISCEDIIFELAKENNTNTWKRGEDDQVVIRSDGISITEEQGFAVLSYDTNPRKQEEPFKIVSDLEDFIAFVLFDQDTNSKVVYENWSLEKSKSHLGMDKFVRCQLNSIGQKIVATVSNTQNQNHLNLLGKDVELLHQYDCGHALVGDEVLVQLSSRLSDERLTGQVKGILKRAHDPTNCLLICQAIEDKPGIMKPVMSNLPYISLLTISSRLNLAQKGNVCIYRLTSSKCIEFSHYERASSNPDNQCLFVVRYLTWLPGLPRPIGVVVGVLKPADSVENGMKIFNVLYNMQKPLTAQAAGEVKKVFDGNIDGNGERMNGRQDLTSLWSFTIGEDGAKDIEMAISITGVEENYDLAIHVSDVAAFIPKDSALDQECERRGASLFPPGQHPEHMLPVEACNDICSLKANANRLAITVVVRMDENSNQIGDLQIFRSVINVKQRFSFSDVENILQNPNEAAQDYIKSCVVVMHQFCQMFRIERLGNAHFSLNLKPCERASIQPHLMINEVKYFFNAQVAALLADGFKQAVPILVQPAPYTKKLDCWKKENAHQALNCVSMSRAFALKQLCHCSRACTCVFSFMRQHQLQSHKQVFVLKEAWTALCQAISADYTDMEHVRDLISNVENLPEVALSALKFASIQRPQQFVSSDSLPVTEKEHYSLGVSPYTIFTSPLCKFISVVLQRILVAYMDGRPSPYTSEEVEEICSQASITEEKVAQFHSDVFSLHLAAALQTAPLSFIAMVEKVDQEELFLRLPGISMMAEQKLSLMLSAMDPLQVTVVDSNQQLVKVAFEERVYDHALAPQTSVANDPIELNPHRFVCSIPSNQWQRLLMNARETTHEYSGEKESSSFFQCIQDISQLLGGSQHLESKNHPEIVSGVDKNGRMRHRVPFSLQLSPSQCLQVQITSYLQDGIQKPVIQLVSMTEQLDFCMEHRQDPQKCFSEAVESSHLGTVSDISSYQNYCFQALATDSAYQAVMKGERLTIHNIAISWSSRQTGKQRIQGEFTLSDEFCRRSSFKPDSGGSDDNSCLAFLCVRYSHMPAGQQTFPDENVTALYSKEKTYTWVGHCQVCSVQYSNSGTKVKIKLMHSSIGMPQALLTTNGRRMTCTVEWIEQVQEHRVLDKVVRDLQNASQFLKDLVLEKKLVNTIDPLEPHWKKGLKLSDYQQSVIMESYAEPFSVICGGPGTGKTTLGVILASLFATRNRMADDFRRLTPTECRAQVLICAPTENSLDVITGHLLEFSEKHLCVVRVYSEEVEDRDYPTFTKADTSRVKTDVQKIHMLDKITLHHLIRRNENPESKAILEQEIMSLYEHQQPQDVSVKSAIERAQMYELKKAHIILCTCTNSARQILQKVTNIKQVIFDDCSLISELECLVPPSLHKNINQVVLIGDQHMPQPPMNNPPAAGSSLVRSLLHRYCNSSTSILVEQWRGEPPLASFLSSEFYSDLTMTSMKRLPPSPSIRWPSAGFRSVFCHVEETESTDIGKELCIDKVTNQSEVSFVASLAKALIQYHHVTANTILVVTFSKAQKAVIENQVPPGVIVCTVLESLGRSSKYVIISTVRSLAAEGKLSFPAVESKGQYLGVLADPKFVNLAITRADASLFIVGDKNLLDMCEVWQSLLNFYRRKQAIQVNSEAFLVSLMV